MMKMEDINKAIPLSNKSSGYDMTDIEKTGMAALTMGTVSPEAIRSLTGLKKNAIRSLLAILEETGWDMHEAIGRVADDRQGNLTYNQESYPILRQKGAFPCE